VLVDGGCQCLHVRELAGELVGGMNRRRVYHLQPWVTQELCGRLALQTTERPIAQLLDCTYDAAYPRECYL
jgi:hypothetical protein